MEKVLVGRGDLLNAKAERAKEPVAGGLVDRTLRHGGTEKVFA